jgi:16S rRNA (cytosine967-C5)-methyltransferase
MSVLGNQRRTLLTLLGALFDYWREDRNLAARIQTLLARNRSFGSRDRRLYRELIYTTLRYLPWMEPLLQTRSETAVSCIAWLAADLPATSAFRAAFVGHWPPCPCSVAAKAAILAERFPEDFKSAAPLDSRQLLPDWIDDECSELLAPPNLDVIHTRAPLWLRVNPAYTQDVLREFATHSWRTEPSRTLPNAYRVLADVDVTKSESFQNGFFEIQDLGSQLILESAGLCAGEKWLDACAGAGGKTLQLAALLGEDGSIDAFDVRESALEELSHRAARAGIKTIRVLSRPADGTYDGVLVDAPCTGSGTWRRAPHLKWTTTRNDIQAATAVQLELLRPSSARVRLGGRLLYATCSVNRSENEGVVAKFLSVAPNFSSEPLPRTFGGLTRGGGTTFLPALHDSDGFFVAAFRRQS